MILHLTTLLDLEAPSCGSHFQKFGLFYARILFGLLVMKTKFRVERISGYLMLAL